MYNSTGMSYTSQAPSYSPSPLMTHGGAPYTRRSISGPSSAPGVCRNTCRSVGVCTCK